MARISVDRAESERLFEGSFSERFKQGCPFGRFVQKWSGFPGRIGAVFDDPFQWEFESSPEYVSITSTVGLGDGS